MPSCAPSQLTTNIKRAAAELASKIIPAYFVPFVPKSPDPIPLWRLRADKYNLFLKGRSLAQSYYNLKEHTSYVVPRSSSFLRLWLVVFIQQVLWISNKKSF